ncbi:MAG: AzlC family ABC transporter permease [Eubacterium sp.]|nr:AzlC family ABC transporter permease [Eubacterium sp.]
MVKNAFLKSLPVMAGYIVLGIGFGILLQKNGYGVLWALAMSLFIYAGSMQYVGVSLIASGASLITAAVTTLMVNARHLFYGISMISKYKKAGKEKPYLIFALTDETYSLVAEGDVPEGCDPHRYWFLISLFNQCYWAAGSVAGSLIGRMLPFDTKGIEFSMTALFLTVFVEQWITEKEHLPALIGAGATAVSLLIFGREKFLIPAMILITVLLTVLRKRLQGTGNGENPESVENKGGEDL